MGLLHRIQMYGDSILKGVELDTANRYIVPRENSWQFLEEEYIWLLTELSFPILYMI